MSKSKQAVKEAVTQDLSAPVTKELLAFSDLAALNSSAEAVGKRFQQAYLMAPNGIAVNSETAGKSPVQPAITQAYSHPCYKMIGAIEYKPGTVTNHTRVVGSTWAINEGTSPVSVTVSVTGGWSETTEWTSSASISLGLNASLTIQGVFSSGVSFNVTTSIGKSDSNQTKEDVTSSVTLNLQPKTKVPVFLVATMEQEEVTFSAPIAVEGMFGANFPNKVNGHYYWFMSADQALPVTSGVVTGRIADTHSMKTEVKVGEAVPIAQDLVGAD